MRGKGKPSVPWLVGLGVLGTAAILVGLVCFGILPRASARDAVDVVGDAFVDFGTVETAGEKLEHAFVLRNRTGRTQTVRDVKKTCGCLDASVSATVVPDGGSTTVTVSMSAADVVGSKSSRAVVVFEDLRVPAVPLDIRVQVRPRYVVRIEPMAVLVGRKSDGGTRDSVEVTASEYLVAIEAYDEETEVEAEGLSGIHLEQIEPWDAKGWSYTRGYVRRSKFRLSYEIPSEWDHTGRALARLRFRRVRADGAADDRCEVALALCKI